MVITDYKQLCRVLIKCVSRGYGRRCLQNPENEFGTIWDGLPVRQISELFISTLHDANLTEQHISDIADILLEESGYEDEECIPFN